MHYKTKLQRLTWFSAGWLFILLLGGLNVTAAQEGSKGLKPDEAGIQTSPRRRALKPVTFHTPKPFTRSPAPRGAEYGQVGVTIWRVDSGRSKGLAQVGEEQTIERLDTNAPYTDGDTIRLIIESPTRGLMYIVDQEQYADGSYGPAMLVFPTLKTRKGNNLIEAWTPVEIPAYPAVWRFRPRELKEGEVRKVQVAEVLTIIISPANGEASPIQAKVLVDPPRFGNTALALNKDEFESWRMQWQRPVQQFDVDNSVGQIAKSKGVELVGNEDEFGTQTIYRVATKRGNPILVTLPLRFKTSAVPGGKN